MLKAKLVIIGGDAKAGEISLKLPTTIGRGKEADLTIPHALVSRAHSKLFERDGQLWVEDLGSLNGTFVDNTRIESEQLIEPNRLLTLGNITFRAVYEFDSSAQKTLPSTILPDSLETITVDPSGFNQTASNPQLKSGIGNASADAETNFAEPILKQDLVADPGLVDDPGLVAESDFVLEEKTKHRSAISEIDSFDPDEVGSLDSVSEKIIAKKVATAPSPPKKLNSQPTDSPNLEPSSSPQKPPLLKQKLAVVHSASPKEVAINPNITENAPVAQISSINIDIANDVEATPVSFIGKMQTDGNESHSVIEDFQIDLDSDHKPEADVDVSRLDSFLKKLPK